jgi:hypothetical protein
MTYNLTFAPWGYPEGSVRWESMVGPQLQLQGYLPPGLQAVQVVEVKRGLFPQPADSERSIVFSPQSQDRECKAWTGQFSRACASSIQLRVAGSLS